MSTFYGKRSFYTEMGISRKWSGKVSINRWLQKHLREGDGKAHFLDEMNDFHEFPTFLYEISFRVIMKNIMEFMILSSHPLKCFCRQWFIGTFRIHFHKISTFRQNHNFWVKSRNFHKMSTFPSKYVKLLKSWIFAISTINSMRITWV